MGSIILPPRQNTEGPRSEYKNFEKNAETEREVTKLQFLS